jgi:UDP-N-acetyl-D-mannosaminuronic acid transferase (WecB/TagA/CpsF family)
MAGRQPYDGNTSPGVTLGASTSTLVALYGGTGVAQAAAVTSVTTTGSTSTTNAFGYTTAAQADAIVASLNALILASHNIGMTG